LATSLVGSSTNCSRVRASFDIDSGVQTQVILIAGVTAIATVSVVLGVDKGLEF
jgi:choline/glycine/proline betaine transport protein